MQLSSPLITTSKCLGKLKIMSDNSEYKIDNITKQVPALGNIPRCDRLKVSKQISR